MIQAIIFDFDGTILETELPDYISWQETYQEHECELPLSLWLSAVGGAATDFDPYAYLEQQLGGAQWIAPHCANDGEHVCTP
jgi:beta-phosphoglucomutase-like phosphatase (HAD superfamily)